MKAQLLTLMACAALALPLRADEDCCTQESTGIEQKLREIDLAVALKQYQEVRTEMAKVKFQLVVLRVDHELGTESGDQRLVALEKRLNAFRMHAQTIRAEILELSKPLSLAAK